MAHLDSLLDDALLGFDDDEADTPAAAAPAPAPPAQQTATTSRPKEPAAAAAQPGGTAAPDAAAGTSLAAAGGTAAAAAAAAGTRAGGGSLQFDPLKRKKKPGKAGAGAAAPAAAAAARDTLGSSSSSGSGGSRRPALTPQVHQLQEDLAKLMSDWSQALHPEADDASGQEQQQQQQRASSSVLQALAAQTQRTVDEQARLQPPLPGSLASAAAAAGAAGPGAGAAGQGGEQQQVNAIVDVVMQHLLSKDVLYQPMKEIKDKYPPWLERHAAPGAASSLPAGDLQRYQQQYAIICTLVQAYESEPDNTAKLMDLLQQMQACGEPPAEIVEEMSSAIAADLPGLTGAGAAGAGGGLPDLDFDNLDIGDLGLDNLPAELKNCPVQ